MKKIRIEKKMKLNKELVSRLNDNQLYSLKGGSEIEDEEDFIIETGFGPCEENATIFCESDTDR